MIFCTNCGHKCDNSSKFCPSCGQALAFAEHTEKEVSPKRKSIVLILAILFGIWGIHRFYVKRWGTGLIWLFTFGLFGIGYILDIICIAVDAFRDKDGLIIMSRKKVVHSSNLPNTAITNQDNSKEMKSVNCAKQYDVFNADEQLNSVFHTFKDVMSLYEQQLGEEIPAEQLSTREDQIRIYKNFKQFCYARESSYAEEFSKRWEHCSNSTSKNFEYIDPYLAHLEQLKGSI